MAKAMYVALKEKIEIPIEPPTPPTPCEKFTLLKEFSLRVPGNFVHETYLDTFAKNHRHEFAYGYNDNLTSENFKNASVKLVPGKTYKVKIFDINERVTSDECLAQYRAVNAILAGTNGVALVYERKRKKLPKGKWSVSFDRKEALPVVDGYRRVPCVDAHSDGDFKFDLGRFEGTWHPDHCLLCFCDEQPSVA
jgi:hypothetical protein